MAAVHYLPLCAYYPLTLCLLWIDHSQAFWFIIRAVPKLKKRTSARNRCVSGFSPLPSAYPSLFAGSSQRKENQSPQTERHETKERAGKDGFHSVPLFSEAIGDGVESVLTVRWQAQTACLAEQCKVSRRQCVQILGEDLRLIREEVARRNLSDISTARLLTLSALLRAGANRLNGPLHLSESTDAIPPEENQYPQPTIDWEV